MAHATFPGGGGPHVTLRRFLRDTRAGATAIAAAAVTVMTVGGAALVSDHIWLVDQRDVVETAADAAGLAATLEMTRLAGETRTDAELKAALESVAKRYILLNLGHLPSERYEAAKESLAVTVGIDRDENAVAVAAEADLGGTLFSRRMPLLGNYTGSGSVVAETEIECSGGIIEVVLALDVTASMNGKIDKNESKTADNHRIQVAIESAKTLVEELHSTCDDTDVVVGVVPWDKTVRLPSHAEWKTNNWVDTSAFSAAANVSGYEAWDGCVADRLHAAADPRNSVGLSLTLPATTRIPAWMYPDTNQLDSDLIKELRDAIYEKFSAHDVKDILADAEVDELLKKRGDNPWNRPKRGPNYQCTWSAMLPLTAKRDVVETALGSLYDTSRRPVLMGGVTMSHLGLTWGRRMLAPSWRDVWGDDTHPVDPADNVTKALVLLTDGQNGAYADGWGKLPGRVSARYDADKDTDADKIVFGCNPKRVDDCHILRGDNAMQDGYASLYTAVGRFGKGRSEDGFPDEARDFSRADTAADAADRLKDLMLHSCGLAHTEGLDVYTVSLLSPSQSISAGWKDQLVACSGNSATTTTAEREKYHLQGTDRASLVSAFREIGKRIVTVRRTS